MLDLYTSQRRCISNDLLVTGLFLCDTVRLNKFFKNPTYQLNKMVMVLIKMVIKKFFKIMIIKVKIF